MTTSQDVIDSRHRVRDIGRWDAELVQVFRDHKAAWEAGEIRLRDFGRNNPRRPDGSTRWYASPLGDRVLMDKADLFDLIEYKPSLQQCMFHASTALNRCFSGGARAGKSMVAGYEVAPILLTPGTQTWLVGEDYEVTQKEFEYIQEVLHHPKIWPYIKDCFARRRGGGESWSPRSGSCELKAFWGDEFPSHLQHSWVRSRSAKNPVKLLSEELDCVVMCEGAKIKEEHWENKLKMRLTTRNGIAIFPTTPSGMDWTSKLYEKGINGEYGHFSINADARMNPSADLDVLHFRTKDMSDEDFNEQVRGVPTPKHGLVYRGFSPTDQTRMWEKSWPEKGWKFGRAIDFGYTDPFVVLWIAVDEDWNFYVYDEFYRTGALVQDVVKEIAKREGYGGTSTCDSGSIKVYAPPSRRAFVTITDWDASQRAVLARSGLGTMRKASKDILGGVQSVQECLVHQDNGKPKLFVSPRCKNLRREFLKYEWSSTDNKPKPGEDHALDALRYFIKTVRPRGSGAQVHSLRF